VYIFICENSIDGIFTSIYEAWASHLGHKNIKLISEEPDNYELFCEYIHVKTDLEKSAKVSNTVLSRCGEDVWSDICTAIMANEFFSKKNKSSYSYFDITKADAVYRVLLYAFSMQKPEQIMNCLGNPYVMYVFELCRHTTNEAHHLLGFLRFNELENRILFSRIHPSNYVLPILADHFCDRLSTENFIIYDEIRDLAVLHKKSDSSSLSSGFKSQTFTFSSANKNFLIMDASSINQEIIRTYSDDELEYQKLWCGFFDSIAIESRKNTKLQNQNIPKRFQKDALEFQK